MSWPGGPHGLCLWWVALQIHASILGKSICSYNPFGYNHSACSQCGLCIVVVILVVGVIGSFFLGGGALGPWPPDF